MKISTTPPKSTHKSANGTTQATRLDGEGLCLWKKYLQLCLEIREIEVAELLKASVRLSNELAKINRREKINALLAEDGKCPWGESIGKNLNKKRNHCANQKSICKSVQDALNDNNHHRTNQNSICKETPGASRKCSCGDCQREGNFAEGTERKGERKVLKKIKIHPLKNSPTDPNSHPNQNLIKRREPCNDNHNHRTHQNSVCKSANGTFAIDQGLLPQGLFEESLGESGGKFWPEEKRKENHDLTKLREQRNEVFGQLVAFMQLHQRGGCA